MKKTLNYDGKQWHVCIGETLTHPIGYATAESVHKNSNINIARTKPQQYTTQKDDRKDNSSLLLHWLGHIDYNNAIA